MSERSVLEFEGIGKSYGSIRALEGFSFSGRIVTRSLRLLGPNGAGKTTALEIALGLRDADSGTARIFDASPRDMSVRRRVGATPQESGFPDMLSVDEIAQFVAAHYPRPALTARDARSDSVLPHSRSGVPRRSPAGSRAGSHSRSPLLAIPNSSCSTNRRPVSTSNPAGGFGMRFERVAQGDRFSSRRTISKKRKNWQRASS